MKAMKLGEQRGWYMNYWGVSVPWCLAFRSMPALLLQLFLRPLGTAFYFWQEIGAWREGRSQGISASLCCGQRRAFLAMAESAWLFQIPAGHTSLRGLTSCWAASAVVLARPGWSWLLGFGNTTIPLCPAALGGRWPPAVVNFGVASSFLFGFLALSSPLWPIICIKFPVFEILEWFQFS